MVERAGFEPAKPVRTTVLQTVPISHSGTSPQYPNPPLKLVNSPRGESNPLTYRLQVGCAAIAPLGRKPESLKYTQINLSIIKVNRDKVKIW
jgi:hypothetical protein